MSLAGLAPRNWRWMPGAAIAIFTGVYQLLLASDPPNDQFMNIVWGREIVASRWPVRDYFEAGEPLSEAVSAFAEKIFGYRLLSEAVIVGIAFGLSAWLVYRLVRQLTTGIYPAVVAALLIAVAGTRGYSYPKILIYAVAATLVWNYVRGPSFGRLGALGAWIGVAFLWRHDHGIYLAAGSIVTLAVVHGPTKQMLVRSCQAAALALIIASPYLWWVQVQRGVISYMTDGRKVVGTEFAEHSPFLLPSWPIHRPSDLITIDSAARYAPSIRVKWTPESTTVEREEVTKRFHLASNDVSEPLTMDVRLLDPSSSNIRALVNDPMIADTQGIDRRSSSIPTTSWDLVDRLRFRIAPLRIRLPMFEEPDRAADTAAWMFLLLIAAAIGWCYRTRSDHAPLARQRRQAIAVVAALSLTSMPGLMRQPLLVYAPDFIVLPAILAGWAVWVLLEGAAARGTLRVSRPVVAAMTALLLLAVGSTGLFWSRIGQLPVDSPSVEAMRDLWVDAWQRLTASPPADYWYQRHSAEPIELAKYVGRCTAPGTPLLVLDFAPEIQYYADRPLASRHLLFGPGRWDSVTDQQWSVDKLRSAPPPIVIARRSYYRKAFQREYPVMASYINEEYQSVHGSLDGGRTYLVLTNQSIAPVDFDADSGWPCFAPPAKAAAAN